MLRSPLLWQRLSRTAATVRLGSTASTAPTLKPAPENQGKPATLPARFVDSLPAAWQPYARLSRLDKPIGTWLLYSPCTWSITCAAFVTGAPLAHTAGMLALFGAGAVVTRGAGCTINDLWDRDLDAKVARTMLRPLASGAVTVPKAVAWLAVQCTAGLGILLCLPSHVWVLGAVAMIPVAVYPLFKRITYYPQIMFSICFTWGSFFGAAAMGVYNIPAMAALTASAFAWGIIYDTIYAHQDKLYDISAGIKSTALAWGERTKPILRKLEVAQIGFLALAGALFGMGPGFFAGTAYAAYRVTQMIRRVDLDNPDDCWYWFLNNIRTGHVIWGGALFDYAMRLLGFY